MEWTQFTIFFLGVFGLFIWNRTEARADIRHMDNKLDAIRELTFAIQSEVKDFHGRLERQNVEFNGRMEKMHAEFNGRMEKINAEFNGKWLLLEEKYLQLRSARTD